MTIQVVACQKCRRYQFALVETFKHSVITTNSDETRERLSEAALRFRMMDFANERYVRLYQRDTVTWLSWSFETRSVFILTLRKVDRSGILDTGKMDKAVALALLIQAPNDVAARALKVLVDDGTVVLTPTSIVLPRYIEAQEAKQSDVVRQRESRENRKNKAVSTQIHEDACHTVSQDVTDSHTVSQIVTPAVPSQLCLAEPAVPILSPPKKPASTPRAKATDPRMKPLTDRLVAAFVELRGPGFQHGGVVGAQALKSLLAHSEPDEIERRWRIGLVASGWKRVSSFVELANASKWNDLGNTAASGETKMGTGPNTATEILL